LEEKMMMKKGKFLNPLSLKQAELEKMKKGENGWDPKLLAGLEKMKKGEEKDLTLWEKNLLWVQQQEVLQELELKKKVLQ
jgi:hypothetical protein